MKVSISASLFTALFVCVHSAPVATPGERAGDGVFAKFLWSVSERSELPREVETSLFPKFVWSRKGAADTEVDKTTELPRDVETSLFPKFVWSRKGAADDGANKSAELPRDVNTSLFPKFVWSRKGAAGADV